MVAENLKDTIKISELKKNIELLMKEYSDQLMKVNDIKKAIEDSNKTYNSIESQIPNVQRS